MNHLAIQTFNQPWDFQLLDSGNGYRLEKWGQVVLVRPDPQIIWQPTLPKTEWDKAWAIYQPGIDDNPGNWKIQKPVPNPWIINFKTVRLLLKLSAFKHTGIFAEQAYNWEWMLDRIKNVPIIHNAKFKILNLFAYTGGATMVLAKAGCQVTHVDASKPAITWANENFKLNNLPPDSVRWILDDCVKFVKREVKRGAKYDGIIMDPPAFGHSPTGKAWKFNQNLPELLTDAVKLLSTQAKFLIINGYATNSSSLALNNLLEDVLKNQTSGQWQMDFGELCLQQTSGRYLSTGIFTRGFSA